MTCQNCQDEATFHLTKKVGGTVHELHLCLACAQASGLLSKSSTKPQPLKLELMLQAMISAHVGEQVGALAHAACACCGTKFMQFRAEGRLGCPIDYEAFARGLAPILKSFHGATRHVGKRLRAREPLDARPILKLRAQLRAAIAREDFELAAQLRDQLRPSAKEPTS